MEKDIIIKNSFIIPIGRDFLVYFPLVGISALLNKTGVTELLEQLKPANDIRGMQTSKLFDLAQDILQSPILSTMRKTGELNPDFLGIIPTRACNGACNYCDFGAENASLEKMPYQMAANIVDWYSELLKSQKKEIIEIHFFGGEPMVARDVIDVVLHRARLVAGNNNIIPIFEISTNGQFSAKEARFLGNYFNKVVLSLDGFKNIQDIHRPLKANKSSFENAIETAKILSDSNAQLCIRSCVSNQNVSQMEVFTKWLCEKFRISAINFEILCESSHTNSKGLFPPDPIDFAIHFQKSREISGYYGIEAIYASDINGRPVVSSCPVGKDAVIVSPDGRISNCYLQSEKWQKAGMNLDMGFIDSDGEVMIDSKSVDAIRQMVETKPRCKNCFCQWSCAGGCHVGITYPGCDLDYDNFCTQTRLISAFTLLANLDLNEKIEMLLQSPEELQLISKQLTDKLLSFDC